ERSGTKAGNQGRNATVCAIEMARLLKQLSEA
ncbi:MAG: 6,7-dimethyl-8-ribityllumazine synthase, partial [SAR324 cluster bacterium]|nr:6,7-dimethyl-8-ribityllumazine synthase [SAR324 cluster bacterium]